MPLDEKQLALRRTGISGTDIGAICGLSEFRSPLDVWADKTGRAAPVDMTPALERGIYLEDGILRWYVDRTKATDVERPGTVQLAGQPRVMATPDALVWFGTEERRGVEVKAPGPNAESGWGEPGTDQVPAAYLCQGVFEMAVLGVERLDFAALLGGELRIYPVKRDREVEGRLIEKALAFWRDYVEADRPPPPTTLARDVEWVRAAFPAAKREALAWETLTPEVRLLVEQYLDAHASSTQAEEERLQFELRLKLHLGDAAGITRLPEYLAPYGRIDWKENTSAAPSWKKVAEAMRDGATFDDAVRQSMGTPTRPFVARKLKKGWSE